MNIEIRLIRNANSLQDDRIMFRRRHQHTNFLQRYTDGTISNQVWVNEKTPEQVIQYIDDMFQCVRIDTDPFRSIQISIPGFPLIYTSIQAFTKDVADVALSNIIDYVYSPPSSFTV